MYRWSTATELSERALVRLLGIARSKYFAWKDRYGRVNEHNSWIPRDFWLTDEEKAKIVEFAKLNPLEGYRRLTYMMIDGDIVIASPSTVYRVLAPLGLLSPWKRKPSKKGTGFEQPLCAHSHWHIDVSYLNIKGSFYYLCSVLDGYSRAIVHWEVRTQMTECDVEIILQRAREKYPDARPRIISDNGPQFVSRDFKEFIRVAGMTHVRTSPYYPQSNGKLERFHRSLKEECIRQKTPLSLEDAERVIDTFVKYYNEERLHSAIGYITPASMLAGRREEILRQREAKLEQRRLARKEMRAASRQESEAPPAVS